MRHLPAACAKVAAECASSLGWLSERFRYDNVECSEVIPKARLPQSDIQKLLALEKIEPADPRRARGTCRVFTVDELAKQRRRCIQHTRDINDCIKEVDPVSFLPWQERHLAVLSGSHVIDLDFSAFYDQMELDDAVRDFFVFEAHGKFYRMKVLSMGQRQSVGVAHRITQQLLNFEHKSAHTEPYIDNTRFVGSRAAVIEDATMFLWRCFEANVTCNEVQLAGLRNRLNDVRNGRQLEAADEKELAEGKCWEDLVKLWIRKEAENIVKTNCDWLGEAYDYEQKTVWTSEKTRQKIRAIMEHTDEWTWRNFAAATALLIYASRTLDLKLSRYFAALRAYREASTLLQAAPEAWEKQAVMEPHTKKAFKAWADEVLAAEPRKVNRSPPLKWTIMTDASVWGYGALIAGADGTIRTIAHPWSQSERENGLNAEHSTEAEPMAIYKVLCEAIPPGERATARIITDHDPAVYALKKGYAKSFNINKVCYWIQNTFPDLELSVEHIAGSKNSADGISRGKQLTWSDWKNFVGVLDV